MSTISTLRESRHSGEGAGALRGRRSMGHKGGAAGATTEAAAAAEAEAEAAAEQQKQQHQK